MDISEMGEFSLIAGIRRRMEGRYPAEVVRGIGDDCAVLRPHADVDWVITTDAQVEDIHFRRAWLTPYQIGWRAIAVNLSDIAAMGAHPFGALAAFTLPATTDTTLFEEMLDGLCDIGLRFDCPLIGGNLSRDPARLTLTLTVLGRVPRGQALLRGTARPGDDIWISGRLGGSAAGLRTFLQSVPLPDARREVLQQRYAQPQPRIREALFLRDAAGLTGLIDLSDGLAGDLGHICEESGVGAEIMAEALPIAAGVQDVAMAMGDDPLQYALNGGEDFELCCTAAPGILSPLVETFRHQFGLELSRIGSITPGPALRLIQADGSDVPLLPQAYNHFRQAR
jgi:thiamine-monophosphate kinase